MKHQGKNKCNYDLVNILKPAPDYKENFTLIKELRDTVIGLAESATLSLYKSGSPAFQNCTFTRYGDRESNISRSAQKIKDNLSGPVDEEKLALDIAVEVLKDTPSILPDL